ncbi:MAG: SPASM domain-containing protein, partial [Planctomycetes bacterium]|nr:SPASM domain-containing protein [Planctomycetota bacterium]
KFVVKSAETWANTKNIQLTKYLITNGTLLNSERIKYLKEHSVTIQVSADGDAKTHDQFRRFKSGEPSMDSIRPQIEMLNAIGANFNLRAVLTRQNLSPSHVTEGLRSLGATKVSFEVVATDLPEAHLNGQDWSKFNERYAAYLQVPYSKWLEMPMELQQTIIRICEARKLFYGCGAGKSEVTIGPDGSIYPCQRMYEKPVSHVDEDLGPKGFDKHFLLPVDDSPVCKECWVRYLCGGGCKHVYHMEGNDGLPIPDYCKMKINIAESAIAKISEIRLVRSLDEKDNPSNPEDIVGRLDDDYASS